VLGLGTQYNGEIIFNGHYAFFGILFKPSGFHTIFRIPTPITTDLIIYGEDMFGSMHKRLFEQLGAAGSVCEMVQFAEAFLLYFLNRQKSVDYRDGIITISNWIVKQKGLVSIDKLAYDANMSIRTFERHFTKLVGMPPKLFCCVTRFNHALELKLQQPAKDWTAIAHEAGYFDQMHLIKDFKRFAGNTPSSFLKATPYTEQAYTSYVAQ